MADFRIRVIVDSSGARRGAAESERALTGVQNRAKALQGTLLRTFGFIGIAAGVTAGIGQLSAFSDSMAQVRAISAATETQFKTLRATAEELGATTRFSANEAAQGMVFLARAGFNVDQVLGSIDGTLKLAQAGSLDLARAADIASNVLKGFALNVEETQRVVDVLALTANRSNTNVEQLGDAMKFVAPVAQGLGVSVEETASAIAKLSDAGLQGTLAGTGLRRVLGTLEAPTGAAAKVLLKYVDNLDKIKPSVVGLTPALEELAKANISAGDALRIFEQRGGPAFLVLQQAVREGGLQQFNDLLGEATGTVDQFAEIMDNTLGGALARVRSALAAANLAAGEFATEGLLRGFLEGLAALLRKVAANIGPVIQGLTVLGLTAGTVYTLNILRAVAATKAFTAVLALNPFTAAVVAIGAIVAAFVLLQDKIKLFGSQTTTLGNVIKASLDTARTVIDALAFAIGSLFGDTTLDAKGLLTAVTTAVLATVQAVLQLFDLLAASILGTISGIRASFKDLPGAIAGFFVEGINASITAFEFYLQKVIDGINFLRRKLNQQPIEPINFGRLENQFSEQAVSFVDKFRTAFAAEFGRAGLSDIFEQTLQRAEEAGLEAARNTGKTLAGAEDLSPPVPLDEGTGGVGDTTEPDKFAKILDQLRKEAELLRLSGEERAVANELLNIEKDLKRDLTPIEKDLVTARLEEIQLLQQQAEILDSIQGPQETLVSTQRALNELLDQGRISWEQYNVAMDQARLTSLGFATDLDSGVMRGLLRIKQDLQDLASVAERALTNAFRGAEDALVQFVTTGKADIKGFVDSALADLTRLLFRRGLLALIGALSGGAPQLASATSGSAGGLLGGLGNLAEMQNGGSFKVGGQGGPDSQLVAFKATPGEPVAVGKDALQKPAALPELNVTIVNDLDPQTILGAFDTEAGTRIIFNRLEKNPKTLKRIIDNSG